MRLISFLSGQWHHEKRQAFRRLIILSVGACLLALLLYVTHWTYVRVKRHVFGNRVAEAMAKGEDEKALAQLKIILQQYPNDREALRTLLELGEKQHAPWVLSLKKRIFDLDPSDSAAALDLAEEACRNNQPRLARWAVKEIAQSAPAENILGMTAMLEGDRKAALEHFQTAYKLKPDSSAIVKNYAACLLSDPENDHSETVRSLIQKLAENPQAGLGVERLRLALALQNNQINQAREIAAKITARPDHLMADSLQEVSILAVNDTGAAEKALDLLCKREAEKPEHTMELLAWLHRNGHHHRALALIEKLPDSLRQAQAVRMTEVETLLRLKEYQRVRQLLENSSWGDSDFLRFACLANVFELEGETGKAAEMRHAATAKVLSSESALPFTAPVLLNYVSSIAEWDNERQKLLWGMTDSPVLADHALNSLLRFYQQKKDAHGLARVFLKLAGKYPEEKMYLNNAVSLALLTGVSRQWASTKAEELFKLYPDDPVIRSTYAYALALGDQSARAYEVVSKIDPKLLSTPEFALYYGFVLNANGMKKEAESAWKNVDQSKLLDTERLLLKEL